MKIVSILILLVFQNSFANQESDSVRAIEKLFLDEIQAQKSSDEDKFLLYNLAGRELYNYKHYEKSKEYYEKSAAIKTSKDKTEVYINLMAIEYAQEKTISESSFRNAMDYFKSSNKIKEDGIKQYMDFIRSNFIDDSGSKVYKGFFGEFSKQKSITKLIEEKKYKEALSIINSSNMDERDLGTQVLYDLLRSIVLGKGNTTLFCKKKLNDFPNSIAWTIEACKVLSKYIDGKLPTKKDIEAVSRAVKEQQSSRQYLVSAFGDLK